MGRPLGKTNKQCAADQVVRDAEALQKKEDKAAQRELAAADLKQRKQKQVASRQCTDLQTLQKAIKKRAEEGNLDASDIGHLSRATKTLHDLERTAYGFGLKSSQVRAVIIIPAAADSMEAWEKLAEVALGRPALPAVAPSRLVVPDEDD